MASKSAVVQPPVCPCESGDKAGCKPDCACCQKCDPKSAKTVDCKCGPKCQCQHYHKTGSTGACCQCSTTTGKCTCGKNCQCGPVCACASCHKK
uniref:Metallothionein n=1 Tax=Romanomermis culicivorax TaxID=13658 RepID=A0A915J2D1_ROMCU